MRLIYTGLVASALTMSIGLWGPPSCGARAEASMVQDAAIQKEHTFYLDSRDETQISKRDALKGLLLDANHPGVYKCTRQIVSDRATLVNAKKPKK